MDVPVELRRKMIIALIEALKESPSFCNIQMAQLKEAVLNSENQTFQQAKNRDEYVYYINEKLKKIRNTGVQKFEFRSGGAVKGGYAGEAAERGYGYEAGGTPPVGGKVGYGKMPAMPFNTSPYGHMAAPPYGAAGGVPYHGSPYTPNYPMNQAVQNPYMGTPGSPGSMSRAYPKPYLNGVSPKYASPGSPTGGVPKRAEPAGSRTPVNNGPSVPSPEGRGEFCAANQIFMRPPQPAPGYRADMHFGYKVDPRSSEAHGEPDLRFSTNRSFIGNVGPRPFGDGAQKFYPGEAGGHRQSEDGRRKEELYKAEKGKAVEFLEQQRKNAQPIAFQEKYQQKESPEGKFFEDGDKANRREEMFKMCNGDFLRTENPFGEIQKEKADKACSAESQAEDAKAYDYVSDPEMFCDRKASRDKSSREQGRRDFGSDKFDVGEKSSPGFGLRNEPFGARADKFTSGDQQGPRSNTLGRKAMSGSPFNAYVPQESHVTEQQAFDEYRDFPGTNTQDLPETQRVENGNSLPVELEAFLRRNSLQLTKIENPGAWRQRLNEISARLGEQKNSEGNTVLAVHRALVAMQKKHKSFPFLDLSQFSDYLPSAKEKLDYAEYFERSVGAFEANRAINKDAVFQLSSEENE